MDEMERVGIEGTRGAKDLGGDRERSGREGVTKVTEIGKQARAQRLKKDKGDGGG